MLRAAIITLRIGLCHHFSDFAKIMAYNRTMREWHAKQRRHR